MLRHAYDASAPSPVRVTARHVPAGAMDDFLRLEGTVQFVLNSHPHEGLPQLLNSLEVPEDGATAGFLVFPPFFGDLHSYVRSRVRLPEPEARSLFRQVATAVAHCHAHRIVLRDMKLGKIMFATRGHSRVVIADLDGAQELALGTAVLRDQKGSPAYVAPEVLLCRPYNGFAADVWSLGVILYVMVTGTYPFQDSRYARGSFAACVALRPLTLARAAPGSYFARFRAASMAFLRTCRPICTA